MSNVSLFTLVCAVALIVVAVIFEMSVVSGGTGVILIVALGYAYTVAKREVALLAYAMENSDGASDGAGTDEADAGSLPA